MRFFFTGWMIRKTSRLRQIFQLLKRFSLKVFWHKRGMIVCKTRKDLFLQLPACLIHAVVLAIVLLHFTYNFTMGLVMPLTTHDNLLHLVLLSSALVAICILKPIKSGTRHQVFGQQIRYKPLFSGTVQMLPGCPISPGSVCSRIQSTTATLNFWQDENCFSGCLSSVAIT